MLDVIRRIGVLAGSRRVVGGDDARRAERNRPAVLLRSGNSIHRCRRGLSLARLQLLDVRLLLLQFSILSSMICQVSSERSLVDARILGAQT